ncbi:MAG TPA: transcription termination/antitermination protein NusG [Acidimicrobiia bacterium]|nr:transcription termination/antitermination protein NusG [Acidimicrobiia bacterium]
MPDAVETAELEAAEVEPDEADAAEGLTPEVDAGDVEAPDLETPEEETAEVEASDVEASDVGPAEEDDSEGLDPVEHPEVASAEAEAPPAAAITEADTVEIEVVEVELEESEESSEAEDSIPAPKPASPYDLPGDWYVIHSYSGYENKVKANLETRIQSMHMGDRIFEVHIPMEDVVEFKAGKKVTVPKKVFPGYILVRMSLDDDSWYAVRNTPGVTGFVAGNAQKPTPLSRREVERFLGVQEEEEKVKPRFKPEWEVGEQVRVVTGPFADFNGVIEDMNVDQQKVVVLVNIFGRDTPVELGFEDIQKS